MVERVRMNTAAPQSSFRKEYGVEWWHGHAHDLCVTGSPCDKAPTITMMTCDCCGHKWRVCGEGRRPLCRLLPWRAPVTRQAACAGV